MVLKVANLNFSYANDWLLKDINFSLSPTNLLHVKGRNGSGKSTLLKLVAGLLPLEAGSITFKQNCLINSRVNYLKDTHFIGHKRAISANLTVLENCIYNFFYQGLDQILDEVLALFNLLEYKHTRCKVLSEGLLQRVALTKLCLASRTLWILDEPLVGLDQSGIAIFNHCLQNHLQSGGMVILTSHHEDLTFNNYQTYTLS